MTALYEQPEFVLDKTSRTVTARFRLVNRTRNTWREADGFLVGWQMFDPHTATFINEGEWTRLRGDIAPSSSADLELALQLPKERGRYHIYISPLDAGHRWFYERGLPFILVDAEVNHTEARLLDTRVTTLRALRIRKLPAALRTFIQNPLQTIYRNFSLIRSLVRRDVLTRYRGSVGDVAWTILHPLLLMATYFFVFGIVLKSRFGADTSQTGFALYFLAGMLPWMAFTEAVGRAPSVVVEHRNFVKKLVFPIEILPVIQVASGVVTQAFATGLFLLALGFIRGELPSSLVWLPAMLIPQILFTLGIAWGLAALGVFLRDLGQIIGFLLTLWFFLTPICYPESALPSEVAWVLTKNPMYFVVHGYRAIFLEAAPPDLRPLAKFWLLAIASFFFGHALFYKLRKSFADVI